MDKMRAARQTARRRASASTQPRRTSHSWSATVVQLGLDQGDYVSRTTSRATSITGAANATTWPWGRVETRQNRSRKSRCIVFRSWRPKTNVFRWKQSCLWRSLLFSRVSFLPSEKLHHLRSTSSSPSNRTTALLFAYWSSLIFKNVADSYLS